MRLCWFQDYGIKISEVWVDGFIVYRGYVFLSLMGSVLIGFWPMSLGFTG